jgi:DNA-binding response OmpR family regulator
MGKRILVVEDDIDLAELLCFNLTTVGYHVLTAHNGLEALKKVRSAKPDLILLDLLLPELDGFAVCEILKRAPATANIPIIVVTALTSQLSRFAGLGMGADDYLTKPFSLKVLISRVSKSLVDSQRNIRLAEPTTRGS